MECVTGIPSHNTAAASRTMFLGVFVRGVLFPGNPTNRRRAQMQTRSSQHLRHTYRSDRGKKHLQLPYEIPHEIRKAIDGLNRLDDGSLAMLVDATHPQQQRLQVNEEDSGGLLQRPSLMLNSSLRRAISVVACSSWAWSRRRPVAHSRAYEMVTLASEIA